MSSIDADQVSGEVGASQPGGVVGARLASPVEQEGPLTDYLQFFADYKNWSAGEPLPNVYPDNSGIQSLTDNNTVQDETASPLVGSKSGSFTASNAEYHQSNYNFDHTNKNFYASFFLKANAINQNALISTWDGDGWLVDVANGVRNLIRGIDGNVYGLQSDPINTGKIYFVEAWFTQSDTTLHIRINDGTEKTLVAAEPKVQDLNFSVGARSGGTSSYDGLLDQISLEVAPQGELKWPSASTWLYNNGNGRSWNEIKTYQP